MHCLCWRVTFTFCFYSIVRSTGVLDMFSLHQLSSEILSWCLHWAHSSNMLMKISSSIDFNRETLAGNQYAIPPQWLHFIAGFYKCSATHWAKAKPLKVRNLNEVSDFSMKTWRDPALNKHAALMVVKFLVEWLPSIRTTVKYPKVYDPSDTKIKSLCHYVEDIKSIQVFLFFLLACISLPFNTDPSISGSYLTLTYYIISLILD